MDDDIKSGLYLLNDAQHATVLAALQLYQQQKDVPYPGAQWLQDMASNGDTVTPLDSDEIDALCEDLDHHGLAFRDVVPIFAEDDRNPYVAAAHDSRHLEEGGVEVDAEAVVSKGEDAGAYVMAWLWVSDEEAGIATGDAEEPE